MLNAMDTDSYLRVLAQKFRSRAQRRLSRAGPHRRVDRRASLPTVLPNRNGDVPAGTSLTLCGAPSSPTPKAVAMHPPEDSRRSSGSTSTRSRGPSPTPRIDCSCILTSPMRRLPAPARSVSIAKRGRNYHATCDEYVRPRDVRDGAPPERRRSRAWRASLLPPQHGACHAEHQGRAGRFPSTPPAT
jgi:hypothetical protein